MKIRVPPDSELYAVPALGPLQLLDFAAALAASALNAQHLEIQGDFHSDESDIVTTARVLVTECKMLRDTLKRYRRRAHEEIVSAQTAWPF